MIAGVDPVLAALGAALFAGATQVFDIRSTDRHFDKM